MYFPSLHTTLLGCLRFCVAGLAMNEIVSCWPVNHFCLFLLLWQNHKKLPIITHTVRGLTIGFSTTLSIKTNRYLPWLPSGGLEQSSSVNPSLSSSVQNKRNICFFGSLLFTIFNKAWPHLFYFEGTKNDLLITTTTLK